MPEAPIRREAQIREIVNIPDPVLRNLWITQAYHDLGLALAGALSRDSNELNASWLGFAVWASNTAGVSIRGEELPARLRALIAEGDKLDELIDRIAERHPNRLLFRLLRRVDAQGLLGVADKIVAQVAEQIAQGNTMVFQELAPIYARMIELIERSPDHKPDAQAFAELVRAVASDASSPDSERALGAAFANYFHAASASDPKIRAEFVLLANAQAVLHEQQRLDGPINQALDAPVREAVRDVFHPWLLHWLPGWMLRWFDGPLEDLVARITDLWQEAATEHLMTLDTSQGRLRLGDDVPALPGEPLFPLELGRLDNVELQRFADKWDRTHGTGRPSGARDWGNLAERMNYVFTLFRSRQQDAHLLDDPFTTVQIDEMTAGRVPAGLG